MNTASIRSEIIARSEELRALLGRRGLDRPRLFGSVARGEDGLESDIDIIVDAPPGTSLLDLCHAQAELEDVVGRRVDLVTLNGLHPTVRAQAIEQAIPL